MPRTLFPVVLLSLLTTFTGSFGQTSPGRLPAATQPAADDLKPLGDIKMRDKNEAQRTLRSILALEEFPASVGDVRLDIAELNHISVVFISIEATSAENARASFALAARVIGDGVLYNAPFDAAMVSIEIPEGNAVLTVPLLEAAIVASTKGDDLAYQKLFRSTNFGALTMLSERAKSLPGVGQSAMEEAVVYGAYLRAKAAGAKQVNIPIPADGGGVRKK